MNTTEPIIRVFLSHKSEHAAEAYVVKRSLERLARGRLNVFVAGRDIAQGFDWRDAIRAELRQANLLLLMFTEPTLNWDWCLYEVGLYSRLEEDEVKPVICLHKGEMIPAPIKHLQAVEARQDLVEAFVRSLATSTDLFVDASEQGGSPKPKEALRSDVDELDVEEIAASIVTQFDDSLVTYHPCHRIVLERPPDGSLLDNGDLLSDAALVRPGNSIRTLGSVFGFETAPTGLTWGDLVGNIEANRPALWERELGERLRSAVERKGFEPIVTTFRGARSGIYCPEIYEVDFRGSELESVTLVFDSMATPDDVGGELFKLLKADVRFRDEVFEHFKDLPGDVEREGHEAVFGELRERIRLIYKEADGHRIFEPNRIRSAYGDELADEVQKLGAQWNEKRAQLRELLDAVHMPVSERTAAAVEILDHLRMLNHAFTIVTVERIADVIGSDRRAPADATQLNQT